MVNKSGWIEKYLLKEVVDFRWCDQDCASNAAEIFEEFNTRVLLNIYFRNPPFFSVKTAEFIKHYHFVSQLKKKIKERGDQVFHTATACSFSL